MKRIFLLLTITTVLLIALFSFGSYAVTTGSNISARSAVLYCSDNSEFVFEKDADTAVPMASLTKVMTALVVLDRSDPQSVVEIPSEACGIEGSSVYLTAGEKLTVGDLLYALMLESANDAAVALALSVSDSVSDFAELMNRKAEELSLTSTHFTNPHGLDDEDHYSSARDLALLFDYALRNEDFAKIVSTYKYSIPYGDDPDGRSLVNHNRLLNSCEGCIGGKTGYTKRTGRCLVSACRRKDITLICVTLNDTDDWADHRDMFDYGFSILDRYTLVNEGTFVGMHLISGTSDTVRGKISTFEAVLTKDQYNSLNPVYRLKRFYYAPVNNGDVLGSLVWYCEDKLIGSCEITSIETIESIKYKRSFWSRLFSFLN